MGGTRDAKDQARAEELRQLASKLEISVSFYHLTQWSFKLTMDAGECQFSGECTMGRDRRKAW